MRRFYSHFTTGLALLLPLWLFGSYLFSAAIFKEVAPLHFDYAEKKWFYDGIAQGHWNLLYPFNELGHGLLNNPASGLLFLPNFLHALIPFHVASKILFYACCLIFFFGMRSLLRLFSSDQAAGWIALIALGSGLLTSLPTHVALGYASFFPWVIYFVVRLWHKENVLLQVSFCSSALFLLGDPFLIPAAWGLGTLLGFEAKNQKYFLKLIICSVVLVVAVCSPHLLMMVLNAPFNSRAVGIDPFEALSYSTAPIRILDWLLPNFELYPVKDYLGRGFHLQWWFPRIGGGLALTGLITWGAVKTTTRLRWVLLGWSGFFVLLALGQFFAPSVFLFEHAPLLKLIRYPERFLLYLFPALMILAGVGLTRLPKKFALAIVLFCLAENIAAPRRAELILPKDLPQVPSQSWTGKDLHDARYLLCEMGLSGLDSYQYYDVRAQRISMVNGTSNTRSAALKMVGCPWALSESALKWLGITHVIASGNASEVPKHLSVVAQLPQGKIFHTTIASPWRAQGVQSSMMGQLVSSLPPTPDDLSRVRAFAENERHWVDLVWSTNQGWPVKQTIDAPKQWSCTQDFIDMKPGRDQQSFALKIPAGCSGLLNLPWSFQAGWQVMPSQKFLRINGATLGLEIPSGISEIQIDFNPPGAVALAVFSILLQSLLLGTIVFRFFRRPQ